MERLQKLIVLKNTSIEVLTNENKYFLFVSIKKSINSSNFNFIRNYFKINGIFVKRIDNQFLKLFLNKTVSQPLLNNFYLIWFYNFFMLIKGLDLLLKMKNEIAPMFFQIQNQFVSVQQIHELKDYIKNNLFLQGNYFLFNFIFLVLQIKFLMVLNFIFMIRIINYFKHL